MTTDRRILALLAALSAGAPLALVLSLAILAGGTDPANRPHATGCTRDLTPGTTIDGTVLHADQITNARTIVQTGYDLAIPQPGESVAIATALQESGLRNLDHGDRDSLGLFQQRPSQGWGTPAEILDPAHAATSFYRGLLAIPGWQAMPTTQAAQAVQRSAYPDAYAKWDQTATDIVASLTGTCQPTLGPTP